MKLTLLFPDWLSKLYPPEQIEEKLAWVHDFMNFLLRKNDHDQYMVTEYLRAQGDDQHLRPDLAQDGYFTSKALRLLIRERPDTQVYDIVNLIDLLRCYGCMIYLDFHHGLFLCPLMLKVMVRADGSIVGHGPFHEDPYRLVVTTDFPALRMERGPGPNEILRTLWKSWRLIHITHSMRPWP